MASSYIVTGHTFNRESVLTKNTNIVNRKNLSGLLLSCPKLQIEIGRYCSGVGRVNPEDRLCKHCTLDTCKDEMHFILKCPLYKTGRVLLFSCINDRNGDFVKLEDKVKFVLILASSDCHIIKAVDIYIAECFNKRYENVNRTN